MFNLAILCSTTKPLKVATYHSLFCEVHDSHQRRHLFLFYHICFDLIFQIFYCLRHFKITISFVLVYKHILALNQEKQLHAM